MAAVHPLGLLKFNFLTAWMVKRPILHHRAKFCEDGTQSRGGDALQLGR